MLHKESFAMRLKQCTCQTCRMMQTISSKITPKQCERKPCKTFDRVSQWCYIQQNLHGNDKTSLLTFSCLLVGHQLLPLRQLRVLDDGDPCNAITKRKQSLQHGDDCSVKMTECDIAHAMLQHNKRWLECEDDFDTAIAVRKRSVLPPSSRTKAALMIAVCAERFPSAIASLPRKPRHCATA